MYVYIYIDGGCAQFFCTKLALGLALGEPCAFLSRPQSRLSFGLGIFSCPVLVLVFVPRFSACFHVVS